MTNTEIPELPWIGITAVCSAAKRLRESRRPDRLFDDSIAAAFIDIPVPQAEPETPDAQVPRGPDRSAYFVVRTRYFDDCLRAAVGSGIRQVVILGAGLDTRSYRLTWPRTVRVFELDLPEILKFKDDALERWGAAPACDRVPVGADMTGDWPGALAGAGFAPDEPTVWLAEAFLPYLTPAEVDRLQRFVAELSAPGSELLVEHWQPAMLEAEDLRPGREALALRGLEWKSAVENPREWLRAYGWRVPHVYTGHEPELTHGRDVPVDGVGISRAWLVRAVRTQ